MYFIREVLHLRQKNKNKKDKKEESGIVVWLSYQLWIA